MDAQISDEPTMVKVAEADIRRGFPTVDHRHIEATVRSSVHRWCTRAHQDVRPDLRRSSGSVSNYAASPNGWRSICFARRR
jgi:hypothetical protein